MSLKPNIKLTKYIHTKQLIDGLFYEDDPDYHIRIVFVIVQVKVSVLRTQIAASVRGASFMLNLNNIMSV